MKRFIVLLTMVFTLGSTAIVQADLTVTRIASILNDGSLRYMPNTVASFYDSIYLQIEQYLPEAAEALNVVAAKNLPTKYIPHLFDCDDVANVAQATIIEEMAGALWAAGVHAAVPIATVVLCDIYTKEGLHMINLIIFQGRAILYDFGTDSLWTNARLTLNHLAIGFIQF